MERDKFQKFSRYFSGDENANLTVQNIKGVESARGYKYGEEVVIDADVAQQLRLLDYPNPEEMFDAQFGHWFAKKRPADAKPTQELTQKEKVHDAVVKSVASGELSKEESEKVEAVESKRKGGK